MTSRKSNPREGDDQPSATAGRHVFPLRISEKTKDDLRLYAQVARISMNEVATRAVILYLRDLDPSSPIRSPAPTGRDTFPLRLDPATHKNLRVSAALADVPMNDIAALALARYLGESHRAAMIDRVRDRGTEERK